MEIDLISVLIPAYNVEKYLSRCLKSVLRQTYRNLEIVVVDDGSTDGTYEVAKKFAAQDARIVLLQKENQGNVACTRNFLLDHFHGKYCVWVDSDDCLKPRYVEKLYAALVNNNVDMSICEFAMRALPWTMIPPLQRRVKLYNIDEAMQSLIFKGFGKFSLWNKMYRADIIKSSEGVRFNSLLRFGEDLLFNIEYLRRSQRIAYLNEKLYYYSWRAGSEMHQKFSKKHVDFVNVLLEECINETNPVFCNALRGWASVSCCGFVFVANKKHYPEIIERMKYFAKSYSSNLHKNKSINIILKFMLWLGLKTWCRTKHKLGINKH